MKIDKSVEVFEKNLWKITTFATSLNADITACKILQNEKIDYLIIL